MEMAEIACEMPDYTPPAKQVEQVLRRCRRVAIVGLSPKESRDSNRVARYLVKEGYEIVPVNPGQKEILGRPCFKSLKHLPFPVDMVVLFLNPARVPAVVDEAIEMGVPAIWMQLGVVHNPSAEKAMRAGLWVISNRCVMTEHHRMCG
jgi:predicted CoA-binding protein